MPKIGPRYTQSMPKISPRYPKDIPKKCLGKAQYIYQRYAQDILKIDVWEGRGIPVGDAVAQRVLTKCLPEKTSIQTSTETIMTTRAFATSEGWRCSQTGPGTSQDHTPSIICAFFYLVPNTCGPGCLCNPKLLFVFLQEDSCSAGT